MGQYLDMIEVPGWDGNPDHRFPSVSLLIDVLGPDVGNFAFHCHILNHEDQGMMNIIEVLPATAQIDHQNTRKFGNDDASGTLAMSSATNTEPDMAGPKPAGENK